MKFAQLNLHTGKLRHHGQNKTSAAPKRHHASRMKKTNVLKFARHEAAAPHLGAPCPVTIVSLRWRP